MTIKETLVTETKKIYIADDGTEFNREFDCEKYEAQKNILPPNIPQIECFADHTDAKYWFYIASYDDFWKICDYFKTITYEYLDTEQTEEDFVNYPDWMGFWMESTLNGKLLQAVSFKGIENDYLHLKKVLDNTLKGENK